jgi:NAD(P)-dependent dehydrogenase (short-subunit alcohol dehydrogenase family)
MKDKVVLITGATSGIGKETAVGLAKLGATIVFTTRDMDRGRTTKEEIIRESKNDKVDYIHCDLASFDSIRSCCKEFRTKYERLDVLINNAGTWDFKRRESADGIENTFAVNYLAPFLMTNLLLDILKNSAPSRIINVASTMHTRARTINFDDVELKKSFSAWKAYSQSKLAVILFTKILAEKLKDTGVTVNCLHPGMVATNIYRNTNVLFRTFARLFGKNPKEGAETSIYLASSPEVEKITGEYFVDKKIKQSSAESHNMETAKKLWDMSVHYVHLDS